MKKSVLFFSVVLMLLMSESGNLFAQKSFPENPNQGYIDTGIGKGDLIQILNFGDTLGQSTINKITYSDSLVWQLKKEDKRIYFWDIDSLTEIPGSFVALGNTLLDVDIAITEDFFITGGRTKSSTGANSESIVARLKSNPNGPQFNFNPNAFNLWGTIDELFNTPDNPLVFHAFDSTNNRIINYAETINNQITVQGQLFLNGLSQNSSDFSGFSALSDAYFIINAESDSVHKVNLLGEVLASYSPNTHNGVPGSSYELMRPFIEPNGRLTITMFDTTTNGSQVPNQYLLFLTDELDYLDILELPSNGARGEYGMIQEVVVDDYGNIYVSDDISLELKQLEYFNHAPEFIPQEGPKTILNAANFNHNSYLLPDAFVTEPEDYFDWNVNEGLGGIKITDISSVNQIRYDADGNGSYEIGLQPATDYEISVEELTQNRLIIYFSEDTLARVNASRIAFELADRAGVYTGISDTLFINTFKSVFEFDGVDGKDRWELMAPVIAEVTVEDYVSDLLGYSPGGGLDKVANTPPVLEFYTYNPISEHYELITDLDDTLQVGDAFFALLPEDTDTASAGVQDGWPRIDYLDELERATFSGSDYIFPFIDETISMNLIMGNLQDTLKRIGKNIIGNPFGQSWLWSNQFAEKMNVSNDIAIWNPRADSGYGAWEFPTFSGSQEVVIKPGQAFAVFAVSENASLGFKYEGVLTDQVSPDNFEKIVLAPTPKLTVILEAEDGTGDRFHANQNARYIIKPLNPSPFHHEIFGIAEGSEIPTTEVFSLPQVFDTTETVIPFGIRSGRVDTAFISLEMQHVPDYDSVYVRQIALPGDTLKIFGEDGFQIPLISIGAGYQPEGKLELVFKKEQAMGVSNEPEADTPIQFSLDQNYPNPFNPSTQINFQLPVSGRVSLKVYDLLGREVGTLVNEVKSAGSYSINFDASTLSSGMYMYRLETIRGALTRKMMLLK